MSNNRATLFAKLLFYSILNSESSFFVFYAQCGLISEKSVTIKENPHITVNNINTANFFFFWLADILVCCSEWALSAAFSSQLLNGIVPKRIFISRLCLYSTMHSMLKLVKVGEKCNIEPLFSLLNTVPNNLSWVRYPKEKVLLFSDLSSVCKGLFSLCVNMTSEISSKDKLDYE